MGNLRLRSAATLVACLAACPLPSTSDGGAPDGSTPDDAGAPDASVMTMDAGPRGIPPWCLSYPEPMRLPDGGLSRDAGPWTAFTGGSGVGADGRPVDLGGGEVTPLMGCFETTVVETDWLDAGAIRRQDPKDYRGCGSNGQGCPAPGMPPEDQWFFAPDATVPFVPLDDPSATPTLPTPNMPCTAGLGWSFESGRYSPWAGSLLAGTNDLAVYGNNVSIDRIMPPGYQRDGGPGTHIGGDYWEFSRDINYRGRYWAGTSDVRANWRTRPGGRLSETAGFVLESPPFVIATPQLSFLIGGHRRTTQRVELVVIGNANTVGLLQSLYRGLELEESAPGATFTREPRPQHIVVRASTALQDDEYMRRRVYWNVEDLQNMTAYFRIVDTAGEAAHVNADDFRCEAAAPANVSWLPLPDGGMFKPIIGQTVKEPPLWGVTDTHAHVAANLTLGGHYIWGDAADPLENVYDCNRPLPAIRERGGGPVVRAAIPRPNTQAQCFVSAGVIALVTSTAAGVCAISAAHLGAIPFIGPVLAAITLTACTVALATAATALTLIPSLTTVTLHGAAMPTSGGLRAGPLIRFLIGLFDRELVRSTIIHGLIEQQDWDTSDGFHSGLGASYLHQRYHWTMIQRAWQGGLRLMVIDALHSRALQYVLDGRDDQDDWQAFRLTADAVERLTASPTHPRFDRGPLFGIAEIARTPGQARDIIRRNKLALVLGTETQELGKLRSPTDSVEQQVRDLYAMGYRKITPIHGIDNPLGGTGYFNDVYNSAAVFANLSKDERGEADGVWGPGIEINVTLPSDLPPPLGGMTLMTSSDLVQTLKPRAPCMGASCAWNLRAGGWFSVRHPSTATADFIGELDAITFRAGLEGSAKGRTITEHDPIANPDFKFASRVSNLNWLLGNGPGGVVLGDRRCSLDGMFMPLVGELDPVADAQYRSTGRQMNDRGLSTEGRAFVGEMMRWGMIVDSDHLGQASRVDLHRELAGFRADAGVFETQEYPVLGIHTDVRRYQRHTAYPLDPLSGGSGFSYASNYGFSSEVDKTRAEIAHIAANGGTVSPGINGGFIQDPDGLVGGQVRNNCDYSSKSYAIKYLQMIRLTGGRGVTPSTDNNSPSPKVVSRFGNETACFTGDSPERIAGLKGSDGLPETGMWPRDFHPSVAARCRFNSVGGRTIDGVTYPWDPTCPGATNVRTQFLEFNAVEYDDYAMRPGVAGTGVTGRPELRTVIAQSPTEFRDDRALAHLGVPQHVAYGGGGPLSQLRPMRKFRTPVYASPQNRGWDFNIDGLANEALLPDTWQDLRNVGVTWEQLGPMFNSANDFIEMWDRACRLSAQWHRGRGAMPLAECN